VLAIELMTDDASEYRRREARSLKKEFQSSLAASLRVAAEAEEEASVEFARRGAV
jgi:hypothetical protein